MKTNNWTDYTLRSFAMMDNEDKARFRQKLEAGYNPQEALLMLYPTEYPATAEKAGSGYHRNRSRKINDALDWLPIIASMLWVLIFLSTILLSAFELIPRDIAALIIFVGTPVAAAVGMVLYAVVTIVRGCMGYDF